MLTIKEETRPGAILCLLTGRLDGQTSKEASAKLEAITSAASDSLILLDLENLQYLSSAGLRVILVAAKTAKANGSELALCSPTIEVKEILDISGFGSVLSIHQSRGGALDNL